MRNSKPTENEYDGFYSGYVSLVPEDSILPVLRAQPKDVESFAASVPAERETYCYGPGKWSIREVLGHVGDAERVFGYRLFCIARGDETPLPGFDEQTYLASSGYDQQPLKKLVADFTRLRESNVSVVESLDETAWGRSGNANGSPISVRALTYIMVGHVRHHLEVLRDRYGQAL